MKIWLLLLQPERFTLEKVDTVVDECLKTYRSLGSISSLASVTGKGRRTHTVQTNAEWIECDCCWWQCHIYSSLFSELLLKVLYRFPMLQFKHSVRFNSLQFLINCKDRHKSVAHNWLCQMLYRFLRKKKENKITK